LPATGKPGGSSSTAQSPIPQASGRAIADIIVGGRHRHTSSSRQYAVTDGRIALGTVALINGAFVAVNRTGKVVGSFDTLAAAARSLPARENAA